MTTPELTVVVPTSNRRELLRELLASFDHQTTSRSEFDVVVAVDGASDGTVEMLSALDHGFELTVVETPGLGASAARNAGAARARGRVLLFIDDDMVASPELVASHLELHRARERVAGVGILHRRLPPRADRGARALGGTETLNKHVLAGDVHYWDAYGGNLSVMRSVFDEVGGFAVDLPRENDYEFAWRLNEAGIPFAAVPQAAVTEYRTRDWKAILADGHRRGEIAIELHRRHPGITETSPLGGPGGARRNQIIARRLALALRIPPSVLGRIGLVLPGEGRRRDWFWFVYMLSFWSGAKAASDRELWRTLNRGVLILTYHAFGGDGERPSRYVVPARRFARQMWLLKRSRYNVISLAEYLDHRREHRFAPPRSVVITIDDGYVDTDTVARPILERYGIPATLFLITSNEGHGSQSDPALKDRPLLDVPTARDAAGSVLALGAHTRSHRDLTTLEPAEVGAEVRGSKEDLERALGAAVTTFAYPFGESSDDVRRAVREAGFISACGTKPGHNHLATDPFDLRRALVCGTDTLARFALTLFIGDTSGLPWPVRRR
jgi:peptidoglycan/xylan/chitin deacetylase (PgdA/CDA1 family)/glycosyltransferase involved in cell wall biosynthesis